MSNKVFDPQFQPIGAVFGGRSNHKIYVVIAKPTRVCNADCSYCSSPPLSEMGEEWEPEWNIEKFKMYFDKVYPYMGDQSYWIWHGGEPMLMKPDFYLEAHEYVEEKVKKEGRRVYFSIQSNLLGYAGAREKWKEVFTKVFAGALSTSFDPDEMQRTIKGNAQSYSKVFKRSFNMMLEDGFRPAVIGVYDENKAPLMHTMYDWSLSMGEKGFPLRFNYCHPTGRFKEGGEVIQPETYGKALISIYDRWIKDVPNFEVIPLNQMLLKLLGQDGEGHCPWTKSCGGKFLGIEPGGEVYNCTDFADMGGDFCFGNLNTDSMEKILNSQPSIAIMRRSSQVPISCQECEHFEACEGGCARDAALYEHGLYGKFHYCKSWKMVFTRIKESIIRGEADKLLMKYGFNPEDVKKQVKGMVRIHFEEMDIDIDFNSVIENGVQSPFGFGENYSGDKKYDQYGQFNKTQDDVPFENDPMFMKKNDTVSRANDRLKKIGLVIL